MKTELKINPDGIIVLSQLLSGVYTSQSFTTLEKVRKCILMDVYDKLTTKAKDLQRKQTLFDTKKKVTFSLKFSQAYYLLQFLNNIDLFDNEFQKVQIQKIINLLDQKLC